jgi:hydrogenase expression/formation protein HypC
VRKIAEFPLPRDYYKSREAVGRSGSQKAAVDTVEETVKSDLQEARQQFGSVTSRNSTPPQSPDSLSIDFSQCSCCADHADRGRVLELLPGGVARVDLDGVVEEVSVDLIEAAPGDLILVHAKVAIAQLNLNVG